MGKQARMVAGDVEVEVDDVEGRENGIDRCLSGSSTHWVSQLDADEQLRRGDRGDRDIGVVREHARCDLAPAFGGDEHAGVDDQSFHASLTAASPTD